MVFAQVVGGFVNRFVQQKGPIQKAARPVDKSVVKLWKERPGQRNDWLLAICPQSPGCTFSGRLHVSHVQVKLKTLQFGLYPLCTKALSSFDFPPKTVDGPVDKVSA